MLMWVTIRRRAAHSGSGDSTPSRLPAPSCDQDAFEMSAKRSVFFLSDRTGITAETLGNSLLTQFEGFSFRQVNVPFIQTSADAVRARDMINRAAAEDGLRPVLFCTLVEDKLVDIVRESDGLLLDFFGTFIGALEEELKTSSTHTAGRAHGMSNVHNYRARIDAMNYALHTDDGVAGKDYDRADVILIGVSRSGKTPTCLYMALQFGVFAANYPLVEDDLQATHLPEMLEPYRKKIFGLSIDPDRLAQIRQERRPDSRYSSVETCREEVRRAERLFRLERIPHLNTTIKSIEEIAAKVMLETGVSRRFF